MRQQGELLDAAARARAEFDAAFVRAPAIAEGGLEQALRVSLGEDRTFLVPLEKLAGIELDPRVRWVPGAGGEPLGDLLGVTAVRGDVVPVYSLARLIGRPDVEPKVLLRCRASAPLALAAGDFLGHVAFRPAQVTLANGREHSFAKGVVMLGGLALPLLDLDALVRSIERRARAQKQGGNP